MDKEMEILNQIDGIDITVNVIKDKVEPSFRTRFIGQFIATVVVVSGAVITLILSTNPITPATVASAVIGSAISLYLPQPRMYK